MQNAVQCGGPRQKAKNARRIDAKESDSVHQQLSDQEKTEVANVKFSEDLHAKCQREPNSLVQ